MRFYSITNMYLSDIQKGIQTAHAVAECSLTENELYKEWAEKGKTIIVLNGGYVSNMKRIGEVIQNSSLDGVIFNESEEALDGALTVLGLVVPERFYMLGEYSRQGIVDSVQDEENEGIYNIVINEKLELPEESMKTLSKQIESYGQYTEADLILINELNNLRLA